MSDNAVDIKALNEQIEKESAFIDILTLEMNKVIVGQQQMVERFERNCGVAGGHCSDRGARR